MRYVKCRETAHVPTKGSQQSGGWDLYAAESLALIPNASTKIPTGLKMELPPGTVGLAQSRSSVYLRGILVQGVVDSDYRGEVFITCWNLTNTPIEVKVGERVAQLIIVKTAPVLGEPFARYGWYEAESLSESVRGEQGFGSSGR